MKRFNRIALLISGLIFALLTTSIFYGAFVYGMGSEVPFILRLVLPLLMIIWVIIGCVNLVFYFKSVKQAIIKFIND